MSINLYDHQRKAIQKIHEAFKKKNKKRGSVIVACGAGKTLVALRAKEKIAAKRTLVLVPTLNLLRQTMAEWKNHREDDYDELVVCSDYQLLDGLSEYASDLGLEPTLDENVIAGFMRKKNPRVVFCTYQSSPVVAKAQKQTGTPAFDLIVFDEAHRTATGGQQSHGMFKTALFDDNVRAKHRLFMTATPRVYTDRVKNKAKTLDYHVASMDDEKLYGNEVFRFSFAEAIEKGILADYKVVVMAVSNKEIEIAVKNREFMNHKGEVADSDLIASHIAIAKSVKRFGLKKILVFHRLIKEARIFSDPENVMSFAQTMEHTSILDPIPWTGYVAGSMSTAKRANKISLLKSSEVTAILSNAKCLTEGIDVPALDAIAFMHAKSSIVDITQAVGRAIRIPTGWKPKGKKSKPPDGYIIIPMIIGSKEDPDKILDNSAFGMTAQVLRALRDHDERLGDLVNQFRVNIGERPPSRAKDDVTEIQIAIEDLPEHLKTENFEKAIRSKIVELGYQKPTLSKKIVEDAFMKYFEEHGKAPTRKMGSADKYIGFEETWNSIDNALRYGLRGLGGGESISSVCQDLGIRNRRTNLTEQMIIDAAKKHIERTGNIPTAKSPGAEIDFGYPETWMAVNGAIMKGCRGMPGGESLYKLLKRCGVRHEKPKLTRLKIIAAARKFQKDWGHPPSGGFSNKKKDDATKYFGYPETWKAVANALREGNRGLKKGSLAEVLRDAGGFKSRIINQAGYWKELIMEVLKSGEKMKSGEVVAAIKLKGETNKRGVIYALSNLYRDKKIKRTKRKPYRYYL